MKDSTSVLDGTGLFDADSAFPVESMDSFELPPINPRPANGLASAAATGKQRPKRIVVEADEIVFKAGEATISLSSANDGTVEIRAAHVHILGEQVVSEARQTNSIVGHDVVTEAALATDVLGKLIRINGQCVKINC
jgi:hypothetical protein